MDGLYWKTPLKLGWFGGGTPMTQETALNSQIISSWEVSEKVGEKDCFPKKRLAKGKQPRRLNAWGLQHVSFGQLICSLSSICMYKTNHNSPAKKCLMAKALSFSVPLVRPCPSRCFFLPGISGKVDPQPRWMDGSYSRMTCDIQAGGSTVIMWYPPAIKHGNGKSPLAQMFFFHEKISIYGGSSHCQDWLVEGKSNHHPLFHGHRLQYP